jgi:carbon-monoxide dehydrogenase small subunit
VPGEDEVREALAGNLCRCTGYHRIVEAVRAAAAEAAGRKARAPHVPVASPRTAASAAAKATPTQGRSSVAREALLTKLEGSKGQ